MKNIQNQGVDMSNEFGDEADEAIIKLLVVCNNNIVSMIMINFMESPSVMRSKI